MTPLLLSIPGAGFFERPDACQILSADVLPAYVPTRRWFGGKARQPQRFLLDELLTLDTDAESRRLALIRVEYLDGPAETYQLPLEISSTRNSSSASEPSPDPIAHFADGAQLFDALHHEQFRQALLRFIMHGTQVAGDHGILSGCAGRGLPASARANPPGRLLAVEQSNSALIFGDALFVKIFRKLEEGENPDLEITRFLTERQHFEHVAPFAGSIELHRPGREPRVLALALALIPNHGDAWSLALREMRGFLDRVRLALPLQALTLPELFAEGQEPETLLHLAGRFATRARQLGQRTGQTHLALAADPLDPVFAPQPFAVADQRELSEAVKTSAKKLMEHLVHIDEAAFPEPSLVAALRSCGQRVMVLADQIAAREVHTCKIRTHGDYHLGQVLDTGEDFVIIDFEGEPQRSLAERKRKRSPLRDVAGMLRSFHYAAHSALNDTGADRAALAPWAELWAQLMSRRFFRGWIEACAGAQFLPSDPDEIRLLLDGFLLEKAIYEVLYELNNRPTWVGIPIRGILQILREE